MTHSPELNNLVLSQLLVAYRNTNSNMAVLLKYSVTYFILIFPFPANRRRHFFHCNTILKIINRDSLDLVDSMQHLFASRSNMPGLEHEPAVWNFGSNLQTPKPV
jgi:hypothetical protein